MEQSFYFEYVEKYFPGLVLSIVEKLNERNGALSYLYRDMLTPRYSVDGKWASVLANYTRVAADVVALDSELPLKTRDTLEAVTGDIPKLGMKLYLTEKQIKDLDAMIATNVNLDAILQTMFQDAPRVIAGVYERIEDIFLSELSTGVGLSTRSNGTGVRVDVKYKSANQKKVNVVWNGNAATSTPIDDIQAVIDASIEDQINLTDVYADDYALRAMYSSDQVRQRYAFSVGFVGSNIPNLSFEKVRSLFMDEWGLTLHRVARKIKTELNGVKQNHAAWAEGRLVFTAGTNVGDLVWTECAEAQAAHRVADVAYQTVDEYMLVSRYSKNDPLREFTSSQAMVVPIINNVDRIYTLDSKTANS